MLAQIAATLFLNLSAPAMQQGEAKTGKLNDVSTFKADFNAAKDVPRVIIILSPS